MVHSTRDPAVLTAEVQLALEEYQRDFLQPSLVRRQQLLMDFAAGRLPEDGLPRDMLTILLRNEDRLDLEPDVLSREIAFYLQAGSHSTANAMVHAVDELLQWCDGFPDRRRLLETDPLFLQQAVHEALRLHPASPVAWRRAIAPLTLSSGVAVTPDDLLVLDLAAANADEKVFGPDSDRFDPFRKTPGRRVQPFGLTFGLGVHNCLGRDLDAGLVPQPDTQPGDHQYGTVAALVRVVICNLGAVPASDDPPARDSASVRGNWRRFPVRVRFPKS
jgi:cytochrome P450